MQPQSNVTSGMFEYLSTKNGTKTIFFKLFYDKNKNFLVKID